MSSITDFSLRQNSIMLLEAMAGSANLYVNKAFSSLTNRYNTPEKLDQYRTINALTEEFLPVPRGSCVNEINEYFCSVIERSWLN